MIHIRPMLALLFIGTCGAVLGGCASGPEKPPMPQTRGMQGMDPALHEQAPKDPYSGCIRSEEAAAQQQQHPMPQTKGMQGMDPKAHEMQCPKDYVPAPQTGPHIHKAPGNPN